MQGIVYEDEALLIIDKPAGMLVHPTVKNENDTLYNEVAAYYVAQGLPFKIHPVSRLDRFTSGLVIFAKAPFVQAALSQVEINKEYLALVEGRLSEAQGSIIAPIARKPGSIIERCVEASGKYARTDYEVIESYHRLSLVRLKLLTGRTHQLRVHMAYIGCPIFNDHLYGNPGAQARHCLHAAKLNFVHPLTGQMLTITAPLPQDMYNFIENDKIYSI